MVLPAPFGPSRANTSPRAIVRSSPATASTSPYDLWRPRTETACAPRAASVRPRATGPGSRRAARAVIPRSHDRADDVARRAGGGRPQVAAPRGRRTPDAQRRSSDETTRTGAAASRERIGSVLIDPSFVRVSARRCPPPARAAILRRNGCAPDAALVVRHRSGRASFLLPILRSADATAHARRRGSRAVPATEGRS